MRRFVVRRSILRHLLAAALLASSLLLSSASGAEETNIRLAAAGSLKGAIGAMIAGYEKDHPAHVTPTWGPSGLLRQQLEQGEAFDIFASADLAHAQALTRAGLSGPSVMFVRNALCAVVPQASVITTATLVATLLEPATRIGTSTPKSDPSGDYTWAVFRLMDKTHPGAFAALEGRAVKLVGNAIPAAGAGAPNPFVAPLEAGEIALAITYCSSAKAMVDAAPEKFRRVELPEDLSVGPEFGLTLAKGASHAAADFAFYILSPQGQGTLRDFGFIPVALPRAP